MSIEIVWLPSAVNDLNRLRSFIRSESTLAAKRAALRIKEGVSLLQQNPDAGKPVPDLLSFRDLVLPFGAGEYIVRYRRIDPSRIVIVRVRHSRETGF